MRRARPLTLQSRLVLLSVALLAAACAVLGVVSVLTLQSFLVDRLDDQLTAAVSRAENFRDLPPPPDDDRPDGAPDVLLAPGQGEGTLGARVEDGVVVEAGVIDRSGEPAVVPSADAAVLAGLVPGGVPVTVSLGEVGTYRVAATDLPDGTLLVTGLPEAGVRAVVGTLALVALGVGVVVVAGAALLARYLVRRTLRPLARVAATAREVTTLPLHAGEVSLPVRVPEGLTDRRTEVGQVGGALNQLIDHVGSALEARQQSETKVRRFVADASHELRTPLAAIRGYAELSRRSRGTTPPEVGQCLDRVEAAAQRMTSLVEDLLTLARLDGGRGTEPADVDLSVLCLDNLADARAAGPDHRWTARLPAEPVVVTGDGARLHQVVANLLANARVHTPAGTAVVLGLTAPDAGGSDGGEGPGEGAGGGVVLTVEDDGPGIAPALLPHVFERFARGDSSRSRAAGSSGLGLSIVAAVVEAHGGTISAASSPGRTVLTVRLPSAGPGAAGATADPQRARSAASPRPTTVGA